MKAWWLVFEPGDKLGELRIASQGFDVIEPLSQFGFRKPGVNGAVAYLMQPNGPQMRAAF